VTDKATEISKLLAPTVASLGVELMGAEYLPSPGGAVLRLYIDVPADDVTIDADGEPRSVTIEECEAVSREVSAQLDVEDPISGNYTLEVSSPGIDRPLFTLPHYQRFVGETAKVTLRLPQDGRRRLQGRIERVEGDTVVFLLDGKEFPVHVLDSAEAVEAIVMRGHPCLLFVDGPRLREAGLDLITRLKTDPYSAIIPVTVLEGGHDSEAMQGWFTAGADEVLSSLFPPAEQRARLAQLKRGRDSTAVTAAPNAKLPSTVRSGKLRTRKERNTPRATSPKPTMAGMTAGPTAT